MDEENTPTSKTKEILVPVVAALVVLGAIYVASVGVSGIDFGNIISTGNYLTQSQFPAYNLTANSIGYIGCSSTGDSIQAYYSIPGNRGLLWPSYNTTGDTINVWANSSSPAWRVFDRQVKTYGQPKLVWFELCERAGSGVNNQSVVTAIRNLRTHTSDYMIVYVSALNSYNPPGLCPLTGPQGVNHTAGYVNYSVGTGVAVRGPVLGPLNQSTTVSDMCHPNPAGSALLGKQMTSFFDKLAR